MITLDSLLHKLEYNRSPHYCRVKTDEPPHPASAHLFRTAKTLNVAGIYVFERAPHGDTLQDGEVPGYSKSHHAPAPAVYVVEAEDVTAARKIHRKLWNLYFAPFAIILLPDQVRVYTGFNYSEEKDNDGLLEEAKNIGDLERILEALKATAIDTGMVWQSEYAKQLDTRKRVDRRLLKNIKQLGEALTRTGGLSDELANRLIGKYVYLKYLKDSGILTDEWMCEKSISPDGVFTLNATVAELSKLVQALEERFNGKVFPMHFENEEALQEKHVKWVASIFCGSKIADEGTTPEIVMQLYLPFKAYDFEYIPVETLSSIYEQFIFDRKKKGAVYTPEALADYVIAEMNSVKPLERGMKVLDPACGSGIFLVLVYRLLIEKEIQRLGRKLSGNELQDILEESIYGVEKEPDACYVAEFSLILTLLHYLDPRDLQNLDFRFPSLHNRRVVESDFFNIEDEENAADFRREKPVFDWIIGNPPWIKLKKNSGNFFAYEWMENNKTNSPVGDNQISEAFSWRVTGLLAQGGIAGLILPATSLFNLKSGLYRKRFFSRHEVLKVTNFANLRENIWGKRPNKSKPTMPPAVLIYRPAEKNREKKDILHYGPFEINQLIETKDKPWVITVNENEIKTMSPYEAEKGDTLPWKLALWGSQIDRRTIERIKYVFPKTLKEFCENKKWFFFEGPQLRGRDENLKHLVLPKGQKKFNTDSMRKSLYRFSVPEDVLTLIPEECRYIRRGEKTGLKLTEPPHIIMNSSWMSFIVYSDLNFVIPPRQIGISAPEKNRESVDGMKALSLYLSSHLVAYLLFFHVPEWGVFRQARKITISDLRALPTPDFTSDQIAELARLQDELESIEKEKIAGLLSALNKNRLFAHSHNDNDDVRLPVNLTSAEKETHNSEVVKLRAELQERIDHSVYEILKIPRDIRLVINDFFNFRLPLDTPTQKHVATRKPTPEELLDYALELRHKLDDFLMGESFVRVTMSYSDDLIEAVVEVIGDGGPFPIDAGSVKQGNKTRTSILTELADTLRKQVSQWVYIQRGLRFFDGPRIHIYKTRRIIHWTRTRARIDAGDIIGELIQGHDH